MGTIERTLALVGVIAFLDVETTGRDPALDRIVEVGIVIGRGGEVIELFPTLQPGDTIRKV